MNNLRLRARELRKNQTDPEYILWSHIKDRQITGIKFRRQVPLEKYIADFVSFECKLIIEIDGSQHNDTKQKQYDAIRTQWFIDQGFLVLRFWNTDILNNIENVLEKIYATVNLLSPSP